MNNEKENQEWEYSTGQSPNLIDRYGMPFLIGFVLGGVISFFAVVTLNGMSGKSELVSAWRKIHPTMTVDEVVQLMGRPNDQIQVGEEWPAFLGSRSEPKSYQGKHGVMVYVMGLSNVLLVVYDDEGRVAFVSAATT